MAPSLRTQTVSLLNSWTSFVETGACNHIHVQDGEVPDIRLPALLLYFPKFNRSIELKVFVDVINAEKYDGRYWRV